MKSSTIKNKLVDNYVDHGPISIPIKFQTNTPNTVNSRLADTPLLRTPRYYGQKRNRRLKTA